MNIPQTQGDADLAKATEAQHSPLPWKVVIDNGDVVVVDALVGFFIVTLHRNALGVGDDGRRNAEFIVEACNAHASLLAQRDELLAALKGLVGLAARRPGHLHEYEAAIAVAAAAIASAEAPQ